MTTGQRKWAPSAEKPVDNSPKLIPRGDYELVLDASKASIKKSANNPAAVPRVGFAFKVPEVQTANGGSRLCFHDLHLSLKPGTDGSVMPERADGLFGLTRALGVDMPQFSIIDVECQDGSVVEALNAKEVLAWLKEFDGATLRGHIRIEPAKGQYAASNKVATFEEAGGPGAQMELDEAAEPEAEADTQGYNEETGEVAEEAAAPEEFEAVPPPRQAPKAAVRPPQKPAGAKVQGRVVQGPPAKKNGARPQARR